MRRRRTAGRSLTALFGDLGHPLPAAALRRAPAPADDLRSVSTVPRRGPARRGAGRAASSTALSVWRMTSEQTPVLWPLIAAPGLPPTGAQLGIDLLSGGAFYCDPIGWVTDDAIPVTNPNLVVFGKPGRGKSATVKAFALRMLPFGYRVLVLGDTKDEYEPLCRALDVAPIAVGHGLPARINPLDFGPLGHGWAGLPAAEARRRSALLFARWLVLLRGLVGSQQAPFGPVEETAVGEALRLLTGHHAGASRLRAVTLPRLWRALDEPDEELITACRYADRRHFLDATRAVRDTLGSLVKGHLAGLFDDHTTIELDWRAPIQSLSLSRLEPLGDEAIGIALTCLNSWGQAMREIADPGDRRIVIRDETWRQMRLGVEAMKSLDANLRLSRRDADVQVLLAHKPSDMLTAGDATSQAVAIGRDLLHLCDVKVLHGQDHGVAEELGADLGLSPLAQQVVTDWAIAGKGRALWLVGDRAFKVQTVLTEPERQLFDTNTALRPGRPA